MIKLNGIQAKRRATELLREMPSRLKRRQQKVEQDPSTTLSWTHFLQFLRPVPRDSLATEGAAEALELIFSYGQLQDPREQAWLIDQTVRMLTGERYGDFIEAYSFDEEFGQSYSWDQGVAPRSAVESSEL